MLFPWYIKYPNQNDEILNLDWILSTIDNLVKEVANFVSLNTIKYADPIQWNITSQYETNTVVVDPISGTAYISVQPVPSGIGLNNTDYWTVIFTMDITSANKNITLRDDGNNPLATFESKVGDWVLSKGNLYVVLRQIDIGEAYVVDYNIERRTVEIFLKDYIDAVVNIIGVLSDLNTTDKTSIVNAINEVLTTATTAIGDLTDLDTTDKSSIVAAINEVLTTATTAIGDLTDLDTTDKTSIVNAINEVLTTATTAIGDLTDLDTTDKTSIVNAINELVDDIDNIDVDLNYADVKKYGAVGDGVTDDTAAIQDAIDSGLEVYLPAGHYKITSTLTLTGTNQKVRGAGMGKTYIEADSSITAFTLTAAQFTTIEDLYINNPGTGIDISNNSAWLVIRNIFINSFTNYGINAHGEYFPNPTSDVIQVRIENVITFASTGSGAGMHFYCVGDISLIDCYAQVNSGVGIYIDTGCSAIYAVGCNYGGCYMACRIEDAHHPLSNTGGRPERPHNIFFTQCLFDSSTYTAVWKKCFDITCVNGWFGGSSQCGLQLEGDEIDHIRIDNTEFLSNSQHGLWIIGTSNVNKYITVSNCQFYQNTLDGISITYGKFVSIKNSQIDSNRYGVVVDSNTTDTDITGCVFNNNSAGPSLNPTGTTNRNYMMTNVPITVNNSAGYTTP